MQESLHLLNTFLIYWSLEETKQTNKTTKWTNTNTSKTKTSKNKSKQKQMIITKEWMNIDLGYYKTERPLTKVNTPLNMRIVIGLFVCFVLFCFVFAIVVCSCVLSTDMYGYILDVLPPVDQIQSISQLFSNSVYFYYF